MYTFLFYICLILGLLLILIAAISTLFTFLVVRGYNKHKSEINSKTGKIGAELLSDLVPIIKLIIWIPFVKSFIARKIEQDLEKYIRKMIIKQVITDIAFIVTAVMFLSLAGSIYNMNMTWNSIPSLLQTIFKEEEPEPEIIEEDGWSWDSISDNYNGNEFNGGGGEGDREIDTLSYGLSADESTIIIDGLQHVYKIAYISDLHMMQPDESTINSDWYISHGTTFTDRNNGFNNSYEILPKIIDCLNGNSFDAVVFGGDIMDNYSKQNFEYLQEQFNRITNSNTIFIVADHDYLTEMTTNSGPNYAADSLGISGSVKSINIGFDDDNLVLVAQNHSNGAISSEDLDKVKTTLNNATNSLFFTHVPIASLTKASEMETWCKSVHNDQVYYWSDNASNTGYRPSGSQADLMKELYNSESLKGVFTGHVHSSYDTEFSNGKTEHIFDAAFKGSIGIITVKSSNEGSGGSSGSSGNASGEYAIGLDDGTYYWYHQSGGRGRCSCVYCGNWSNASWGNNDCFGSNGCAVYSLAIGYSNLIGQEIKPTDILNKLGCQLNDNGGVLNIDTSVSSAFSGIGIIRSTAIATLANATGTNYSTVDKNITSIDEVLSRGGYVWGSWIDAKCKWCGNGSQHFMMIRKQFGDNYYCFTSCRGKCASSGGKEGAIQTMNYALNKQECIDAMSTGTLYGIWGTNSGGGGSNSYINTSDITSSDVYRILSQNSAYSGKAAALALAYKEAEPLYGSNFAIGLMANIVAEGAPGVVEYSFSRGNAWGFRLPSGSTTVSSMEDIYYLIDWDSTTQDKGNYGVKKGSCGIGMIQWSFGRRVGLAQLYKDSASTFSSAELGAIEVKYMLQEFSTTYASVPNGCTNLTAEECAARICKTYERPANKDAQAIIRSATAADLLNVLSGVN